MLPLVKASQRGNIYLEYFIAICVLGFLAVDRPI